MYELEEAVFRRMCKSEAEVQELLKWLEYSRSKGQRFC
jgi:hypothetical protein